MNIRLVQATGLFKVGLIAFVCMCIHGASGSNKRVYVNVVSQINGMNKWMKNWKKRGWVTATGKPTKNKVGIIVVASN